MRTEYGVQGTGVQGTESLHNLAVSRRVGQRLFLDLGDVRSASVTLAKIQGGQARLCISAPASVRIARSEIRDASPIGEATQVVFPAHLEPIEAT